MDGFSMNDGLPPAAALNYLLRQGRAAQVERLTGLALAKIGSIIPFKTSQALSVDPGVAESVTPKLGYEVAEKRKRERFKEVKGSPI